MYCVICLLESLVQLHFICHPTMANDDPLILSAIEQAKRKHISLTPGDMKEKAAKVQTQAADNSKSMMVS